MRRCGKRYATKEAALRSKKGLTGYYLAIPCRCEGWHLQELVLKALPERKPQEDTGPDRVTRAAVLERDQFQCCACGKPVGLPGTWWSIQHRVARGQGGGNGPENLATLCGSATSPGCHRLAEDRDREMRERGYWLRSDEDPARVPIMLASEHGSDITVWLEADGGLLFERPAGVAA